MPVMFAHLMQLAGVNNLKQYQWQEGEPEAVMAAAAPFLQQMVVQGLQDGTLDPALFAIAPTGGEG